MAYTKGTWRLVGSMVMHPTKKGVAIASGNSGMLPTNGYEGNKDDMTLIAAAPELLEACEELILAITSNLEPCDDTGAFIKQQYISEEIEHLRLEIAKAKGGI